MRFRADDGSNFPEWEEKKLGDVLEVHHGRDYKQLDPGNIPVMGTGGVITYVDKALCDWDCVCIGRKGTINKPIYMTAPFWSVDTLFFTKAKKNHHPLWQYYLFQMINWDRYNEATGVPSLSSTTIESIRISVPSLPEQKKIASLLSSIDSTLNLCQRKLDLLTQAKKALMQQIFSQKLRFKADDGSDFPEWEEKKLGEMAILRNGYAFSSSTYVPNGYYHIITIANVRGEHFITVDSSTSTIDELPKNIAHWQVLKENDILISLTGNVGRVSLNRGSNNLLNQRVGLLEVNSTELNVEYLYQRISSADFEQAMINAGQGAAQQNISKYDIENFRVSIPSLPEQRKIASCLSSADALIAQARVELEQWQEVKKSLLQQLFV